MDVNPWNIDYVEKNFRGIQKCTSKICFGAFQWNAFPGGGAHLPCHVTSPTVYAKHSQTEKYVKQITVWGEISAHKVSSVFRNNRHNMYPSIQRSGFGSGWHLVRLLVMLTFGQMYPQDIWWPSVIPYQVIAAKNLILSLSVEKTKLVIFKLISSYVKNIKLKKSSGHGKIIDSPAWFLHHERPFTRVGNYLVVFV